jgi:hypothetical protein
MIFPLLRNLFTFEPGRATIKKQRCWTRLINQRLEAGSAWACSTNDSLLCKERYFSAAQASPNAKGGEAQLEQRRLRFHVIKKPRNCNLRALPLPASEPITCSSDGVIGSILCRLACFLWATVSISVHKRQRAQDQGQHRGCMYLRSFYALPSFRSSTSERPATRAHRSSQLFSA